MNIGAHIQRKLPDIETTQFRVTQNINSIVAYAPNCDV